MKELKPIQLNMRENLVLAKALAYAITTIGMLPLHLQEASDRLDMITVLDKLYGTTPWKGLGIQSANHHLLHEDSPLYKYTMVMSSIEDEDPDP
jgi:hypothetical protein